MGKNNLTAQSKRISHPPHMPRYRMTHQNRVSQVLNSLRHKLGGAICRGSDLNPATKPGWFRERRELKKEIAKLSKNKLLLIDNGFRSATKRHWFHHRACGNNLFLVPEDIKKQGPDHVCVYCQEATDMQACGTTRLLQAFVYEQSGQKVITPDRQYLKSTSDEYAFYCLLHRESYFTSFKHFLDTAGITNGCPLCAGEASFWDETSGTVRT